jgi:hypothetical protein
MPDANPIISNPISIKGSYSFFDYAFYYKHLMHFFHRDFYFHLGGISVEGG